MKKVLLVNPPVSIYVNKTAFMPLPLLVLGSVLKQIRQERADFGYELVDLDFMLKRGEFADDASFFDKAGAHLIDKRPDVLLFTVHGINHILVLKLAERLKRELPSCLIVAGGVGPTLQARQAIERCPDIDVIVRGEGEAVLRQLLPAAFAGRDFSDVPSIVFRKDGHVVETPRAFADRQQPIPAPDYAMVRIEDYMAHNRKHPYIHPGFVLIESGRGCPHACSFCAPAKMWQRQVRYRPVPELLAEMRFLADHGGNFSFFTQDNLDHGFLRELSEALLEQRMNIAWGCYSRLDRLPESLAGRLAEAGCRYIFTGFETASAAAQKSIRKVVDSSAAFRKLQTFNAHGIAFIGSFIAGFAGESEEDLDHTLRFALECATGLDLGRLLCFVNASEPAGLPAKGPNICAVHPLYHMPGTDSFDQELDQLTVTRYSIHPDCYGSFLFGYDQFKEDFSFLGCNPYLNHFREDRARFYCSVLRLFNFINSRPYYFALLLARENLSPLALMKKMVATLGEDFVLTARIEEFEQRGRDYVRRHLPFVPDWTVKKGQ